MKLPIQLDGLFNAACREVGEKVEQKGFGPQPLGVFLMLVVSELSEALEADRNNKHADMDSFYQQLHNDEPSFFGMSEDYRFKEAFKAHVKDSFEDEIADAIIRLMDLCYRYGIDIETHMALKMHYNELRPYKHGKAY